MADIYPFTMAAYGATFSFVSTGKRSIRKIVRFDKEDEHPDIYGITLLDVGPDGRLVLPITLSENGDGRKILRTVVAIIDYFTELHFDATIYITGTDLKRSRLYCTLAGAELEKRNLYFIEGLNPDGTCEPFHPGRLYGAIFAIRK